MLAHQFGEHLIFLLEFGLHRGQPFGLGGCGPSSSRLGVKKPGPLFKELFLPFIEHAGGDAVLRSEVGNRGLFQQVLAQNGHLLGPGVMTTCLGHKTVSLFGTTSYLTQKSPFYISD